MHPDTRKYNQAQAPKDRAICRLLAQEIDRNLPEAENKIWHRHPVWFLDGNPIVGYSRLHGRRGTHHRIGAPESPLVAEPAANAVKGCL